MISSGAFMPTYNFKCVWTKCGTTFDKWTKISDRDETQVCPTCAGKAKRNWSGKGVLPMAMLASVADGHVPKGRSGEVRNEVEAARLEAESYDSPPDKRGEIKREIKKLRSIKK